MSKSEIKAYRETEKKKLKEKTKAKQKQRKGKQEQDSDTESEEEDEPLILTPDYEEFYFPCNKWLDSKEDDRKTERQPKCKKKQLHYKGGINPGTCN